MSVIIKNSLEATQDGFGEWGEGSNGELQQNGLIDWEAAGNRDTLRRLDICVMDVLYDNTHNIDWENI